MIDLLVDHNVEGHAALLWATLRKEGWLDLLSSRLLSFSDVGLAPDAPDRTVWRVAQAQRLLLLTANRNMQGEDSLEQTIREENQSTSLPVFTIRDLSRMVESDYRILCATRIVEVVIYLESYLGAGRLFIP